MPIGSTSEIGAGVEAERVAGGQPALLLEVAARLGKPITSPAA